MMTQRKSARPVAARRRFAALCEADLPVVHPVEVMGLQFANPLGLAAGFDRTGRLLPALASKGFSHVEVGTITPGTANVAIPNSTAARLHVGVSFGSSRRGLDDIVVGDYLAALARVWSSADYLVANLSSPFLERDGDVQGVDALVEHLSEAWRKLCSETERHRPLLIKVSCGPPGTALPAAIASARKHRLSGVVLVSASLRQIAAVHDNLDGAAVISVGGVVSATDLEARLAAGAALVQIYTTFVRDGPGVARQILSELDAASGNLTL
jgi:dihydroorotate dehydrogenase